MFISFFECCRYFKLVPSLFSMIGSLFFVITSGIRWFSLHRDIRMYVCAFVEPLTKADDDASGLAIHHPP